MSEDTILGKVLKTFHTDPAMLIGPGDDCAVLAFGGKYLLAAVDQVASDVHYRPDTPPEAIAAKVLKRNLSDIAAMGGVPRWALLALAATARDDEWFERFFAGLEACAESFGVAIAGGDLGALASSGRAEYAALTILGEVEAERICRRASARPKDVLMVTGELGDTLAGGHHLDFEPRLAEGRFLSDGWTVSMMDVSDGLARDLVRLGRAAKVEMEIDVAALPCRNGCTPVHALGDGEDYELVFAVAPERVAALRGAWPFATRLTEIGVVQSGLPGRLRYINAGTDFPVEGPHGYEHFEA